MQQWRFAAQTSPLLIEAVASFRSLWEREVQPDNVAGDGRLHYLDAAAFARHLFARWRAGADDEMRAAFEVIERLHVEGDPYVRELATISYLEDVKNVAAHAGVDPDELRPFLGPESVRWWDGLNAFWSGHAPACCRPTRTSSIRDRPSRLELWLTGSAPATRPRTATAA